MKQQTAKKSNIILTVYFVLLALAAPIFLFSYLPKRIQAVRLRKELISARNSVGAVEAAFLDKKSIGRGILDLIKETAALDSRFIKAEDASQFLNLLSQDAKASGVEIISIQPSEFSVYRNSKGKMFSFEDLECNKMAVSLGATGSYKSLLYYIWVLENKNSPAVSIKKLSIDKQRQSLNASLIIEIFAYLPKREKNI